MYKINYFTINSNKIQGAKKIRFVSSKIRFMMSEKPIDFRNTCSFTYSKYKTTTTFDSSKQYLYWEYE